MKFELTWPGLKPNPAPNVLANLQQNQKGEMKSTTKHNFEEGQNLALPILKKRQYQSKKRQKGMQRKTHNSQQIICESDEKYKKKIKSW